MYRPAPQVVRPYQIAFSPQAWSLVGAMEAEAFKSLRAALDRIAQAPEEGPVSSAEPEVRSAQVGEWTVLYERDARVRLLTVRNLVRRSGGGGPGR
jgi:predicted DNA-binding transcriptional regulator YafY